MTILLDPAIGVFLDEAVVIRLDITFIRVLWHPFIWLLLGLLANYTGRLKLCMVPKVRCFCHPDYLHSV